MTHDEFREELNRLQTAVNWGTLYYTVWIETWPTYEVVDILNRWRAFFSPVRSALHDMTLLNLSKVFDRDKRAISFRRLIEAAKQDSNLLPFAKVGQLAEIEKSVSGRESSSAWQSIKQKRDQQLAHLDAGPLQPVPLVKGDFDRFIEGIQSVFDQLWVMHSKSVYNSGHLHSRSAWMTGEVLRVLQEEAGKVALEANHQIRAIQQAEAQNQSQGRNQ